MTAFTDVLEEARDVIGVRRVYGEPFQKNGVTVIPAARVMGGAGAGTGTVPASEGETTSKETGSGTGFGMVGSPAGAYVIKGEDVRWVPALDVNRIVFGAQVVAIVLILAVRSVSRARVVAFPRA
jgi:uncharacterized spore protein YtfJ